MLYRGLQYGKDMCCDNGDRLLLLCVCLIGAVPWGEGGGHIHKYFVPPRCLQMWSAQYWTYFMLDVSPLRTVLPSSSPLPYMCPLLRKLWWCHFCQSCLKPIIQYVEQAIGNHMDYASHGVSINSWGLEAHLLEIPWIMNIRWLHITSFFHACCQFTLMKRASATPSLLLYTLVLWFQTVNQGVCFGPTKVCVLVPQSISAEVFFVVPQRCVFWSHKGVCFGPTKVPQRCVFWSHIWGVIPGPTNQVPQMLV